MAAIAKHQLAQSITCHAWNADLTLVAVCPNTAEVHIYRASPSANSVWERLYVLSKHDQLVSGIDWAPVSNYIVTSSHDRNSYVWSLDGNTWQPTLVILRLNRAATSVKWSPKENKFAVGSSAKSVCVCYYEQDNNWWVSKLIRKKHSSTITSVAWHPNNVILATTSTDCKCRVFAAYIKGVDARSDANTPFGELKFGEQLVQLDLALGWAFGVKWSPSGTNLAYVGHDSSIHILTNVGPSATAQSTSLRYLPIRDVLFLSETVLVAGGYDCNPMLFLVDEHGIWKFERFLDEPKSLKPEVKRGSQFSATLVKFHGLAKRGEGLEGSDSGGLETSHQNCITTIWPLMLPGESTVTRFSTSGLDGRVVVWEVRSISDSLHSLALNRGESSAEA